MVMVVSVTAGWLHELCSWDQAPRIYRKEGAGATQPLGKSCAAEYCDLKQAWPAAGRGARAEGSMQGVRRKYLSSSRRGLTHRVIPHSHTLLTCSSSNASD